MDARSHILFSYSLIQLSMIKISPPPPGHVTSKYPPPVSQGIFSLNLMAKAKGKMALKALIQIPVGFGALGLNVKTYPFFVFATPMHCSLPHLRLSLHTLYHILAFVSSCKGLRSLVENYIRSFKSVGLSTCLFMPFS